MNDERVDFLIEHDFQVGLSHDGPGYHLRGPDPLDNPENLRVIQKLLSNRTARNKMSLICTLTEENHSLYEIYTFLENRLKMPFLMSMEGLVSGYGAGLPNYGPQSEDSSRRIWRQLVLDMTSVLPSGEPLLTRLFTQKQSLENFFESLVSERPAYALGQKCQMDSPQYLAVNLKGEVSTCQNVSAQNGHRIGTLDQYEQVRLTTAQHWAHHANCRNCPVVQLCKGSCMYLMGPARQQTCDHHFIFYFSLLVAGIYILTGQQVTAIRGERIRLEGLQSLQV